MDSNLWTISKESKEIIKKIKSLPVAPVLTFNNFKGGVGKSTLIALFAFIMVKFKIKVLLIDSDPQRTLTKKLMKNFTVKNEASQTFMEGIKNNSLKNCITQLDDYLYIVQGDWELAKLDRYARTNLKQSNEYFLYSYLINDLKKDYNSTNRSFLKKYYETFGDLTFQNIIKYSARVLTWGTKGITENQGYDKQTLAMYLSVFEEFLERINK